MLMDRNWLSFIKLNWQELLSVSTPNSVDELAAKFKSVFTQDLGKIKELEARVDVHPKTAPKFHKAPTVLML